MFIAAITKFRQLVSILNRVNSVHTLTSHIYKIHFNIILSYAHRSCNLCITFVISDQVHELHVGISK
jgi:hypothetical protein